MTLGWTADGDPAIVFKENELQKMIGLLLITNFYEKDEKVAQMIEQLSILAGMQSDSLPIM